MHMFIKTKLAIYSHTKVSLGYSKMYSRPFKRGLLVFVCLLALLNDKQIGI